MSMCCSSAYIYSYTTYRITIKIYMDYSIIPSTCTIRGLHVHGCGARLVLDQWLTLFVTLLYTPGFIMTGDESRIESASRGSISALQPHCTRQTHTSISPRMAKQMLRLEVKGSPKRKHYQPKKCTVRTDRKNTLICDQLNMLVFILCFLLQSIFTIRSTQVQSLHLQLTRSRHSIHPFPSAYFLTAKHSG